MFNIGENLENVKDLAQMKSKLRGQVPEEYLEEAATSLLDQVKTSEQFRTDLHRAVTNFRKVLINQKACDHMALANALQIYDTVREELQEEFFQIFMELHQLAGHQKGNA